MIKMMNVTGTRIETMNRSTNGNENRVGWVGLIRHIVDEKEIKT